MPGGTIAKSILLAGVALGLAACSAESEAPAPSPRQQAEIPANPLRNAYFGDLHLHTSYSLDAAASGTNTVPDDAYRYARGMPVDYMGQTVQRRVPLDFLAVTDHAEYLGMVRLGRDPAGRYAGSEWPALLAVENFGQVFPIMRRVVNPSLTRGADSPFYDRAGIRDNWGDVIEAAEANYVPGTFTTFAAFEWSATPNDGHQHRNVIFAGPDYPDMPFSTNDSMRPDDLWTYAEGWRARGVDSILIPHNSNLSEGMAFSMDQTGGAPMTREWAARRNANEPLVEISQNKGSSETRPELSPDDEFAGFELLAPEGEDLGGGYVRTGLGRGLLIERELGINPMQFGIIAASDFHSGVSSTEEDNFPGGLGLGDSQADPEALLNQISPILNAPLTTLSAGGITGVWAERNTREAIFAALRRREVFATSGPRIKVRMFAGWDLPASLIERNSWVAEAYRRGQPMGGSLSRASGRAAPQFLLEAVKDPLSGNLDRVQVVKVWIDHAGAHEKVFDVVWSGNRQRDPRTGKVGPVGNTVDVANASYANTIGSAQLVTGWTDPEFDPAQPTLYYARVLEIPTPRWPVYLARRSNLPFPEGQPAWLQERAWTSPIWYRP
ncbi:DUF3604 domain-containing protein [Alteraurantiacibacter buctensis]|uniref:DUF3604 domain-containing protein n=1 Tax=Alteraurantiacibacter buctensis TaxID=1503981 RepID=A0A844YW00_9SPHN|nr:DUF3604 domain-containing protein [Alteraurantiacibacter buctensis]MXO71011.1 DUF3604 domain-containing protein [Alteraurantiacibacter buctensis]